MATLPDTWTHQDNIDMVKFGFQMKLLDVPWENEDHLKGILTYFEQLGMLRRKNEVQLLRQENNVIGERARLLMDSD